MDTEARLKILFVEDMPADAEMAQRELDRNGILFDALCVDNQEALQATLAALNPDIVISDYSMPLFNGMEAMAVTKSYDPFMPFIILTGSMNEEIAVGCIKAGANDYVLKEHLSRLPFSVKEAIAARKTRQHLLDQQKELSSSEERYRSLFQYSNAILLIIDPDSSTITDANNTAVEFYGWPRQELIGKCMSEINTLPPGRIKEQIRMALHMKKNHFQFRHRRSGGRITDIETQSSPIRIGEKDFLFSIIHDISDRVAAERERDALSNKLSHYLKTSPTITYAFCLIEGEVHMEWISENITPILGYSVQDALERGWWFGNVAAEYRSNALKGIAELARSERVVQEYRFMKKDRSEAWIRDEMRIVHGAEGNDEIVGTLTDVTAQKQAEAEISLKSAALEASENAVVITDRTGTIEWANRGFEQLTGYSRTEAIGKNPRELLKSGIQDPAVYRQLWDTIMSGKSWHGELTNRRKSGALYNEEMTITPIMDESRRIAHFIAIKNDITEKKHSQDMLESSLREKEVLLREIHHRVKNNMQVVSSLITLSAENLDDGKLLFIVKELNRRIEAMAIIHEQFYQAQDLSHIDFSLYLKQLVDTLIEDRGAAPGKPEIQYQSMNLMITLESAIPAGLIASELLSNALACIRMVPERTGVIKIKLEQDAFGHFVLEVKDNGPGLPEGFDSKHAGTLGMRLIEILTEQLEGTLRMYTDKGTTAILTFTPRA